MSVNYSIIKSTLTIFDGENVVKFPKGSVIKFENNSIIDISNNKDEIKKMMEQYVASFSNFNDIISFIDNYFKNEVPDSDKLFDYLLEAIDNNCNISKLEFLTNNAHNYRSDNFDNYQTKYIEKNFKYLDMKTDKEKIIFLKSVVNNNKNKKKEEFNKIIYESVLKYFIKDLNDENKNFILDNSYDLFHSFHFNIEKNDNFIIELIKFSSHKFDSIDKINKNKINILNLIKELLEKDLGNLHPISYKYNMRETDIRNAKSRFGKYFHIKGEEDFTEELLNILALDIAKSNDKDARNKYLNLIKDKNYTKFSNEEIGFIENYLIKNYPNLKITKLVISNQL